MRRDSHFQINREWTFGRAKLVQHLHKIINIMFKSRNALKQIVIVAFSKFQKININDLVPRHTEFIIKEQG